MSNPSRTFDFLNIAIDFNNLACVYCNDSKCNCIFITTDLMNYLKIEATTQEILDEFIDSLFDLGIIKVL